MRSVDRPVRVLRWTFRRRDEMLRCQLGLDRQDLVYELRVDPPLSSDGNGLESFNDAVAALQRQAEIERTLIEDGWSLETFQAESAESDRLKS